MSPLITFLAVGVVASVVYLFTHAAAQARSRAWRSAAHAAALTDVTTSDFLGIETGLTGRSGMLRVSLERYQRGKHEKGTRIVIDGLGHPSYEFALRKEGVGSAIEKAFGEREIELGDDDFDRRAYIHGSPRVVHAILDSETRALVGELIDGRVPTGDRGTPLKARVAVSDGALRAEIPERSFSPGGRPTPAGAADALLEAARRLTLPDDLPGRLAENVRTEPLPQVRLANLLTLNREYPGNKATRAALRRPAMTPTTRCDCGLPSPSGTRGMTSCGQIATSLEVADGRAARAVTALREALTADEAKAILEEALGAGRRVTARAAVGVLARIGGPTSSILWPRPSRPTTTGWSSPPPTPWASHSRLRPRRLSSPPSTATHRLSGPGSPRPSGVWALPPPSRRSGPWPHGTPSISACVAPRARPSPRSSRASAGRPRVSSAWSAASSGQLSLAEEHGEGRVSMAEELPTGGAAGEEQWPTDGLASADLQRGEDDERSAPHHPPERETD